MTLRIGVDIGGTFTDLIAYDEETGKTVFGKVPTTPANPDIGCLRAITDTLSKAEIDKASYFLHGTTVGLNSLLERRGAKVGLLVTKGMRDILEIRRGDRAEAYNIFWKASPHLVPRSLCQPITGRIKFDGSVHEEFVEEDVKLALEIFNNEGVDTIAVAFMNSYANGEHEIRAEKVLRQNGFQGGISLSHRISGEYREYERTTTTIVDAYVRNRMVNYLSILESGLEEIGLDSTCLITRCGGGSMTFSEAKDRSFETIMSGPVAGAEGSGELSRIFDLGNLISADVGGTSFDTAVIIDGRPKLKYEGEIIGLPLQTSFVDVRTIGSGGGSIAYIDEGGLLKVGPESAGAAPGPACYGNGGERPTTTDAAFYLGMLGEGVLASGLKLSREKAEDALQTVAEPLDESCEAIASGILAIAGAKMANAIREITVEQGLDPRSFKLLAYGGAGPLMAGLMADELSINHIIVPPFAGNFSAFGMLGADMTLSKARTYISLLSKDSIETAKDILDELFTEILETAGSHNTGEEVRKEAYFEMRYEGQEHALSIPIRLDGLDQITQSIAEIASLFHSAYTTSFGVEIDDPIEISAVRAGYVRPLPKRSLKGSDQSKDQPSEVNPKSHEMYSFANKRMMDGVIVERDSLNSEERYVGPAVILEPTATTYVDANFEYYVDTHDLLHLVRT